MAAELFSATLKQLAREQGWNWATLAARAGYNRSHVWAVAEGRKRPSNLLVADLDTAIGADGRLVQAWENPDPDLNRRELLRDLASLALIPVLTGAETIRQDLYLALGGRSTDIWQQAVADFANRFYACPPAVLLRDLLVDMDVLRRQLFTTPTSTSQDLRHVAASLATITALTWTTLGEPNHASRWFTTARLAADASGDLGLRVWVRGWEVCNGPYVGTPASETFGLAAEASELAEGRTDAGVAGLFAGLAQAQAAAGHPDALTTLRRVAEVVEHLPSAVLSDHKSLLGWPEVRLRFTQSYVYTEIGDAGNAYGAQDLALSLYGNALASDRVKVELHRARCLVTDGDVSNGVACAQQALDRYQLQSKGSVWRVAHEVIREVPQRLRSTAAVTALRDRLAIGS